MEIVTIHGTAATPPADDIQELRLDGRVALLTGSARGIGEAAARLLGRRGARVALFDIEGDRLAQTATTFAEAGIEVLALQGDVTRADDCEAAVDACVARWGHLDILVNSAGVGGRSAPLWEIDDAEWLRVTAINLHGTFYFCRAAARQMRQQGHGKIVNIASIAGKEGNPNASHYSATKAAVIGLTKSLGKELATQGVLVNAIAPAVIDTEILQQLGAEHVAYMRSKIPMERFGQTEEVARLIGFLASDHLSFSTGAVYDLSGGRATY